MKDPLVYHVDSELEGTKLEAGRPVRRLVPSSRSEKMT